MPLIGGREFEPIDQNGRKKSIFVKINQKLEFEDICDENISSTA